MAEEKKMTAEEAEAKLKAAQAAAAAAEAELAAAKARAEAAAAEAELAELDEEPTPKKAKTKKPAAEEPVEEKPKKTSKKAEEKTEAPKKKKTAKQKNLEKAVELRAEGKSATGLRIGAILLWVVALVCEIMAIRMFNLADETLAIVFIVADAITCIIGSLLWKRSNRIDPPSKKNKFAFFLKSQMGLIACLICFIPLGILLLKNQDLSAKSKKLIAIIAAVCFVATAGASIDYAPVSAEEVAQAEAVAATAGNYDGSVYWTRWGKSYHFDSNCQSLRNTKEENLFDGSLSEAMSEKRTDPCDFCAKGVEDIDPETLESLLDSFGGSELADAPAEELVEDVVEEIADTTEQADDEL
ncbi:MAG: hypothetical protein IKU72_03535 [Oscillospiraceae bacterium]|nr:hypothetical protein [Oscillospiraceae bacterium]